MIQIDGSHHRLFEDRADKCVLIGFIDDATNNIFLQFDTGETTEALMKTMFGYIQLNGCPVALYADRGAVYKHTFLPNVQTNFERSFKELGVNLIYAYSPQAKGRV